MSIEEVKKRFKSSLLIPREKPARQFFLCPIGLVGAGKTTVMKPLCEQLGLLRISNDEFRKLLKEEGYGWDQASAIAMDIATEYARAGYSIGVDADCADRAKRERIEGLASELHIPVLYIHINPPEQFIVDKLMSHEQPTWLFESGEQAVENYQRRKSLHEGLLLPYIYTFDTSRVDLGEQIAKGVEKIRASLTRQ